MKYSIASACICHKGLVRNNNEDNFYFFGKYLNCKNNALEEVEKGSCQSSDRPVFAVFDGVGGESKGEVASFIGAKTLFECIKQNPGNSNILRLAANQSNELIVKCAKLNQIEIMASTMAALRFSENTVSVCNVGDSKIFKLSNKKLSQISLDQTSPILPGEQKPRLNQYLGKDKYFQPFISRIPIAIGDIFLICSDGITDMIPTEKITKILMRSPEKAAEKLLSRALEAGGTDNITAIICCLTKPEDLKG